LPQPSLAVKVLVCERPQLVVVTDPSVDVTVGMPHASVAVAVPNASLIFPSDGLHPSVVVVPPDVRTGGVRSTIHVTVLDVVDVLPHASLAVHVLVCERPQPLLDTLPSLDPTVGVLQASVAVAVPNAPLISPADGLHPSVVVVPPDVSVGGVRSAIHVIVLDVVDVLPQPSFAVNFLVCVLVHVELYTFPSTAVIVVGPQPSVALADPSASLISLAAGLHPSDVDVPFALISGGVRSTIQLTVLDVVAVLPQPSLAVNVLVWVLVHVELETSPSTAVIVVGPQPSVALADPSASLISLVAGLHPSDVVVPPDIRVGGVTSSIQVTVLAAVDVLPHASLAVNVLVCDREQTVLDTEPSFALTVGVLTASVAVAVPSAELISDADGLHPNVEIVPPAIIPGGVTSVDNDTLFDVAAGEHVPVTTTL
jgi:hypothetical protein